MKRFAIFRNHAYTLYFTARTISWVGTSMQSIANSWLALELTNQAYSVGIILVASTLPGLLFSPTLGVYIDRIDRKWLAAVVDIFRAVVVAAIPLLWYLHMLQPWHLYAMSFLVALGNVAYTPTVNGLIREVVPVEQLLDANTTSGIALQAGGIVGSALGGLIIAFFSPILVMLINSVSFVFSAFCISGMRKGYISPTTNVAKYHGMRGFLDDMKQGVDYIREHMDVVIFYVMLLFVDTSLYTMNVLIAPFTKYVLNVGVQGFGYMEVGYAVGAVICNFFLPAISRRFGNTITMTLGMGLASISLLFLTLSQNLAMALFSYLLLGITLQIGVLFLTLAQERIPADYQGRVSSTLTVVFSVVSFGFFLGMGFLSGVISIRWLYGFQTCLLAIAGWLAFTYIYGPNKTKKQKQSMQVEVEVE